MATPSAVEGRIVKELVHDNIQYTRGLYSFC